MNIIAKNFTKVVAAGLTAGTMAMTPLACTLKPKNITQAEKALAKIQTEWVQDSINFATKKAKTSQDTINFNTARTNMLINKIKVAFNAGDNAKKASNNWSSSVVDQANIMIKNFKNNKP